MVFVAYASGNALGPHFFVPGQIPPYHTGMLMCIVCFCLAQTFLALLRAWYVYENRRRDRLQSQTGQKREADFADLTDTEVS